MSVFRKVDRRGPRDCWEYTGTRSTKGYGVLRVGRKMVRAHRLAYQEIHGQIPDRLCVLHTCDNPPCCNPTHLFLGTRGDNNRDAAAKRRSASGERHGASKLTARAVSQIRRLSAEGREGVELAERFGVTPQTISHIVTRKTWRHV